MQISIQLQIVDLGENGVHLSVPCEYLGKERLLIVDTAASKTVFDLSQLPNSVKVEYTEEINAMGISGEMLESAKVLLKDFKIDGNSFPDFKAFALPLDMVNETYMKYLDSAIFGLLGADFLLEKNAIIDFGELLLKLTK